MSGDPQIRPVDVEVDSIENLLPSGNKLNSSEEVEDFQGSLDESTRKKLINSLASLQEEDNAGDICRTVMRSLMTNKCMSNFSGTGQKGKIAFLGTPLCKVILSAARKASKRTISFDTIKREVLDVLRFAPYQPGGTNYKKKGGRKSNQTPDDLPDDSD